MVRRLAISIAIGLCILGAVVAVVSTMAVPRATAAGSPITYVPIDPKVFVGHQTVLGWVAKHNERAVANHAVALWDALTVLTNQKYGGTPLAVFATWYTPCDVYPIQTRCNHAIVHNPTDVELPEQFFRIPRISSANIFSGVKYNAEMKNFIEQGYHGVSYATGAGLVKAIKANETDLVDTAPPSSMMVKPVYELISQTKPTVIGYWQGPGLTVPLGASTSPLVPDVSTWLKVAVIDPTGKATNTKPLSFCADTIDPTGAVVGHRYYVAAARSYPIVPLKEMYWFPLSAGKIADIAAMRAEYRASQITRLLRSYGPRALAQDPGCPKLMPVNTAMAFVGMHVVSAELNNTWTWQTFWWQPFTQLPGAQGPFRHFNFATAYWTIDKPPYGYRVGFNPYLEAGFGTATFISPAWTTSGAGSVPNLGRTTDCISCHSAATYTLSPNPSATPGYVAHGSQPQIPLPAHTSILTRNLWSLAIRASHPSP